MKLLELSFQDWILKYKIKNIILKSFSWFMFLIGLFGIMGYDNNTKVCSIMIVISMCWLVPYGVVNGVIEL